MLRAVLFDWATPSSIASTRSSWPNLEVTSLRTRRDGLGAGERYLLFPGALPTRSCVQARSKSSIQRSASSWRASAWRLDDGELDGFLAAEHAAWARDLDDTPTRCSTRCAAWAQPNSVSNRD